MHQVESVPAPPTDNSPSRVASDRLGFRPREVARQLGVTPNVVYQAIYAGELDVWRFGRAMAIPSQSLDAWLASEAA